MEVFAFSECFLCFSNIGYICFLSIWTFIMIIWLRTKRISQFHWNPSGEDDLFFSNTNYFFILVSKNTFLSQRWFIAFAISIYNSASLSPFSTLSRFLFFYIRVNIWKWPKTVSKVTRNLIVHSQEWSTLLRWTKILYQFRAEYLLFIVVFFFHEMRTRFEENKAKM